MIFDDLGEEGFRNQGYLKIKQKWFFWQKYYLNLGMPSIEKAINKVTKATASSKRAKRTFSVSKSKTVIKKQKAKTHYLSFIFAVWYAFQLISGRVTNLSKNHLHPYWNLSEFFDEAVALFCARYRLKYQA